MEHDFAFGFRDNGGSDDLSIVQLSYVTLTQVQVSSGVCAVSFKCRDLFESHLKDIGTWQNIELFW